MVLDIEFKCSLCKAEFYYKRYLQVHLARKHGITNDKKAKGGIICPHCQRYYTSKNNLSHHVARIHKIVKAPVACQELNCNNRFSNVRALRTHLCSIHELEGIEDCQNLKFEKHSDFLEWLKEEETKSSSKFVVQYSKKFENHVYTDFRCNRSGIYKPKVRKTMKIGFHCTAAILVKEFSSHVEVSYYKEHYKHEKLLRKVGRKSRAANNLHKAAGRYKKIKGQIRPNADPENEVYQLENDVDPGSVVSSKRKAVKRRRNVLQDELAELCKKKGEDTQQIMSLAATLDEKEKEIAEQRAEIEKLKASLAAAEEILARVQW